MSQENVPYYDPLETLPVKKVVGKAKEESLLDRAFRFHLMVEEFCGPTPLSNENVRKVVGKRRRYPQ